VIAGTRHRRPDFSTPQPRARAGGAAINGGGDRRLGDWRLLDLREHAAFDCRALGSP
jgi:hypothetical protein